MNQRRDFLTKIQDCLNGIKNYEQLKLLEKSRDDSYIIEFYNQALERGELNSHSGVEKSQKTHTVWGFHFKLIDRKSQMESIILRRV